MVLLAARWAVSWDSGYRSDFITEDCIQMNHYLQSRICLRQCLTGYLDGLLHGRLGTACCPDSPHPLCSVCSSAPPQSRWMLDDQIGDPRPLTLESQPVVPNTMPATQSASIISDSQKVYTAEAPPNAIQSAFIISESETFDIEDCFRQCSILPDSQSPPNIGVPPPSLGLQELQAVTSLSNRIMVGRTGEKPEIEDNEDESETDYDDSEADDDKRESDDDESGLVDSYIVAVGDQAIYDAAARISFCSEMSIEAACACFERRVSV